MTRSSSTTHDRVALGRIELDRELRLDVVEDVAAGALDLGQVPERQRILEVAGSARLPDRAPVQQLAEPLERPAQARVRPNLADRRVEHRRIGRQALQAQRARDVHRVEEGGRVRDGQGRPAASRTRCCRAGPCPRRPRAGRRRTARRRGRPAARDRPGRSTRSSGGAASRPPFSAASTRSASSGRTPVEPSAKWLARRSIVARTTSSAASGPWPTMWCRFIEAA